MPWTVVAKDETGGAVLNSLKSIYVALAVRVRHNGSIFRNRAHKGNVCSPFAVDCGVVYVTPKKTE